MHTDQYGREHRYGPPDGYTAPASFSFNFRDDWQRLVDKGLKFEQYKGLTELRYPRGTCLSPLIREDLHVLLVRPLGAAESLVDGDLYVIEWPDDANAQVYKDKMNFPKDQKVSIAKFLRYIGGEWWCQCNESLGRLDGIVTHKVVNAIKQHNVVHAGQIQANAVSDFQTNGPANHSNTGGVAIVSAGTITVPTLAQNATIVVTATFDIVNTSGANSLSTIVTTAGSSTNNVTATGATKFNQILHYVFNAASGTSPTITLESTTTAGSPSAGALQLNNAFFSVQVMKK